MKNIVLFLALAVAAVAQNTPKFPGAVVGYNDFTIASNQATTSLTTGVDASVTTISPVTSTTLFTVPTIIWIDNEAIKCLSKTSTSFTSCTRGFDNTTAATHAAGTNNVGNYFTAHHVNQAYAEIIAIENRLATSQSSARIVTTSAYNFTAQQPGGSIVIGSNSITLTPVPYGVNGTDVAHYLYISGGTGTAESCLITGGSGLGGDASGTIIMTCANTHSGAWTVASVAGGLPEAVSVICGAGGGEVIVPPGTITAYWTTKVGCSDIYIHGSGMSSKFDRPASSVSYNTINVQGSGVTGSTQLFVSDGAENDPTVTLVSGGAAALGLAVGDYIWMNASNGQQGVTQVTQVNTVAGDVITLAEPLVDNMTTANGAKMDKIASPIKRVRIDNIYFDGTNNTNLNSHAIQSIACVECEYSYIWGVKTGGSTIYAGQGYKNTYSHLVMDRSSNSTGFADFELFWESVAFVEDVKSDRSGFGPTFWFTHYSKFFGLHSTHSSGRGVKVAASSHNTFHGVSVYDTAPLFLGFILVYGSHNNMIYDLDAHGNTFTFPADLVFFGTNDSFNKVIGGSVGGVWFANTSSASPPDSTFNTLRNVDIDYSPTIPGIGVTDSTPRSAGNSYGGGGAQLLFRCSGLATASSTIYMTSNPAGACTTTANNFGQTQLVAKQGVLKNLFCGSGNSGINASSGVCTIVVNATDTSLTATIGSGNIAKDIFVLTHHAYTVFPGNYVSCKFTTQAGETLADVACSVEID